MIRVLPWHLLFVYDFIFVIHEAASSRLWHCPNISASKVIKGIWAENMRLGTMLLSIDPEPAAVSTENNHPIMRSECVRGRDDQNHRPSPWQQTTHHSLQEVYTLINKLSRSDICDCKKIDLPTKKSELKKFRGACNRRSTIYNQAALLRSCGRLAETVVHQNGKCTGEIEFGEVKELLAAIDFWSARSMMCVKCSESVLDREHCNCNTSGRDHEIFY